MSHDFEDFRFADFRDLANVLKSAGIAWSGAEARLRSSRGEVCGVVDEVGFFPSRDAAGLRAQSAILAFLRAPWAHVEHGPLYRAQGPDGE